MTQKKKQTKTKTKVYVYSHPNGVEGFSHGIPARDVSLKEAEQRGIVEKLEASFYHELKEV